ncbi:MAG: hypothetical protein RJB39_110 [Candidatus Parcubacteria bacterium]|jgi:penicillin-binding protein 2
MGIFGKRRKKKYTEILPEHVLLDSANLPSFDKSQLEGRVTGAVDSSVFRFLFFVVILICILFGYSAFNTQVIRGAEYADKAERNRFESIPIFAERGSIYDRNDIALVWNESVATNTDNFSKRIYEPDIAMGSLLGYVKYPKKDKKGFYITEAAEAVGGTEQYYNVLLQGSEGSLYIETDAVGNIISKTTADLPRKGQDVHLTIDSELQKLVYKAIEHASRESGYVGGAGLIVDVTDGSILSAVTYPDFDSNVMTEAVDHDLIQRYLTDKQKSYFLNRYTSGLYAPGSIVKPIFALAALNESIITPRERILSTGKLVVANPYQPDKPTIFKDWKAHGYTDVREAIAVSSDVYFYTVGGGVPGKKGLGITKLAEYAELFGFNNLNSDTFFSSKASVIPTPEWKKKIFNGEDWRLGDTYHSAIGQYGFSITPIQVLSMLTMLTQAGDGKSSYPLFHIDKTDEVTYVPFVDKIKKIPAEFYNEIAEGMRMTVTTGTGQALNFPELKVAGKTGTAQTGVRNEFINSWFVGFWPYTKPRYAVVFLLEKGSSTNTHGATAYLREVFDGCRAYSCDIVNKKAILDKSPLPVDETVLPEDTFQHELE